MAINNKPPLAGGGSREMENSGSEAAVYLLDSSILPHASSRLKDCLVDVLAGLLVWPPPLAMLLGKLIWCLLPCLKEA